MFVHKPIPPDSDSTSSLKTKSSWSSKQLDG